MFERRMALLEGAEACFATASGMAAVFASLLCQLRRVVNETRVHEDGFAGLAVVRAAGSAANELGPLTPAPLGFLPIVNHFRCPV
jgi:hypothetical protein